QRLSPTLSVDCNVLTPYLERWLEPDRLALAARIFQPAEKQLRRGDAHFIARLHNRRNSGAKYVEPVKIVRRNHLGSLRYRNVSFLQSRQNASGHEKVRCVYRGWRLGQREHFDHLLAGLLR